MEKQPILVIVGPTASGKTALAVELAKIYNGEVISADSMQIYKGMDIATAKPTVEEQQGIPHHLISFVEQDKAFSVADYVKIAKEKIYEVSKKEKLPIIAGGTGLYISSLIDNIKFEENISKSSIRDRLIQESQQFGNQAMLDKLMKVDEKTAKTLHANNITRIIRALEVYELTGIKLSEHKIMSRAEESPFNACILGLNYTDRNQLYNRIDKRVDVMVENGLIEEARDVHENNKLETAHQAIGFKELIPYFDGNASLTQCLDKIKQESRHYAKRQLTWFRREERINWIFLDENYEIQNILEKCKKIIANSNFLWYNNL